MKTINMRLLLAVGFTCFLFFSFTGCQKEYRPAGVVVDSVITPANDSTLLKLFVQLDTLHPPSHDTLYKMEFAYDDLKRLTSYTFYYYDSADGGLEDISYLVLQYRNNERLPYKGVLTSQYFTDPLVSTYLFDNNNNLLYSASYNTQRPQDSVVKKTVHQGDSDITYVYGYPLGAFYDTIYHKATISNGNLLQDITTYPDLPVYFIGQGINTYNNVFDNRENPFYKVGFVFQLLPVPAIPVDPLEGGSFSRIMGMSKNNIVESRFNRVIDTFSDDNYYIKAYSYNSNGLPVSASYTKQLAQLNQLYAGRELYFYTR